MDIVVMKRKGLTQRQIARKLGIIRNTVKKYIKHQEYPGRDRIKNFYFTESVAISIVLAALILYVVVRDGYSSIEVFGPTSPRPLSIVTVSAFEEVQLSVDYRPKDIDIGSLITESMGNRIMIIVSKAETIPAIFVAEPDNCQALVSSMRHFLRCKNRYLERYHLFDIIDII